MPKGTRGGGKWARVLKCSPGQTGSSSASSLPRSGPQMDALETGCCMSRECLSAGGNLLGVTRRSQRHAWLLSVTGLAPWVDSITLNGLSKTAIFKDSEYQGSPHNYYVGRLLESANQNCLQSVSNQFSQRLYATYMYAPRPRIYLCAYRELTVV